jgi:DNA-binding GntR family transcriptional regulator
MPAEMAGTPAVLSGRLSDQVYAALRSQILDGSLAPGERLVELELAKQLNVSQAPVRDALIRLAHDGLVVQAPRRGSYVASIDPAEAHRAYSLRASLEEYAARDFCDHGGSRALPALRRAVTDMHAAAARNDLAQLIDADMTFHSIVYSASQHPVLGRVWPMLETTIRTFTSVSNRVVFTSLDEIASTHEPLLDALERGDRDAAAVLARQHVEYVWQQLEPELPQGPH